MKLGLYGINMGACLDPRTAIRVAVAAEAAGFESVWTAEHVVLPEPRTPESPIPARVALLDPAVALAHLAGHTKTIRLATGIIILPQRNPVVLAKELASLDVLSDGRLIFGLGAGYIPKEFAACGIPFGERGARTDEAIAVLRDLWTSKAPHFNGRFFRYSEIDAHPRPIQRPHPPIVVGRHERAGIPSRGRPRRRLVRIRARSGRHRQMPGRTARSRRGGRAPRLARAARDQRDAIGRSGCCSARRLRVARRASSGPDRRRCRG